jgi:hypothetical protein
VVDTVLYQDNKSSILLETNGKASSGKRTRHINIRFFFVADRVASGELRIEHCPTEDMVADYFTKPLQGALFYKLRDQVMNVASSSPYHSSQRSVLEKDLINSLENPDTVAEAGSRVAEAGSADNDAARTDGTSGGDRFSNGKDESAGVGSALESSVHFLKS